MEKNSKTGKLLRKFLGQFIVLIYKWAGRLIFKSLPLLEWDIYVIELHMVIFE